MKTSIKAAVVAFGALGALAIPASAQPYDNGGYGPGYDDPNYDQNYQGCFETTRNQSHQQRPHI